MRRRSLLLFPAALLAACATGPRSVDVSREQLEAALARRFPIETRAGDLFAVRIGVPRLSLLPEANRLRLDVTIEAMNRIVPRALRGDVALSFALRYQAGDATLRADNVRVDRIELQGIPEAWRDPVQRVGVLAAQQMLEGSVLHQFTPDQVARAGGWTPGEIRVTPRGLRIELLPPVS